jgi:transcription initiation factor TFIIB
VGCDLILLQNMADAPYENKGYTSEDFMKLSRTDPATSLMMNDEGLLTVIGTNKDSTGKV